MATRVSTEPEEFFNSEGERLTNNAVDAIEINASKTLLYPIRLRVKTKDGFWSTPAGVAEVEGLNDAQLLLGGLTNTMNTLLGEKTMACIKKRFKNVRDFFENSTPSTQCANVIGTSIGQDCWICGTKIDPGHENLSAECEHVFPILQALVFTGLYESQLFDSLKDNKGDAVKYTEGLKMEYRWAHRICNQVKSDSHFIALVGGRFVVEDTKIQTFLNEIASTESWGSGKSLLKYIKTQTNQDGMSFLLNRVAAIRETCNPILMEIEKFNLTPEEHTIATVQHIKEYVATNDECSGISGAVPKTKATAQVVKDLSRNGNITHEDAIIVIDYAIREYARPLLNFATGKFQTVLREVLRSKGTPAARRTEISVMIGKTEQQYLVKVRDFMIADLLEFRKKIYGHVKKLPLTADEKWGQYQVYIGQFLMGYVSYTTLVNYPSFMSSLLPQVLPEKDYIVAALQDEKFKEVLNERYKPLDTTIKNGTRGVGIEEMLKTAPEEIPGGIVKFGGGEKAWYMRLFGGGVQKRRALYSRAFDIIKVADGKRTKRRRAHRGQKRSRTRRHRT